MVQEILNLALRSPSGGNTQPWKIYVVAGDAKQDLTTSVEKAMVDGSLSHATPEFAIYPDKNSTPPAPPAFLDRRRKLGYAMYNLMGVDRKDKIGRAKAMGRNYDFFGAPVGMIITVEKACDANGWGHVGCLLQSICLLAEERNLGTCLQEAWGNLGRTVYNSLNIPDNEVVWCGLALGYPDTTKPVNTLRSEREELSTVASFAGFSEKSKL
tara:strand:- start:13 stop:648 length:636 start_codon:yes stop_codon:yes gene_type:complete